MLLSSPLTSSPVSLSATVARGLRPVTIQLIDRTVEIPPVTDRTGCDGAVPGGRKLIKACCEWNSSPRLVSGPAPRASGVAEQASARWVWNHACERTRKNEKAMRHEGGCARVLSCVVEAFVPDNHLPRPED